MQRINYFFLAGAVVFSFILFGIFYQVGHTFNPAQLSGNVYRQNAWDNYGLTVRVIRGEKESLTKTSLNGYYEFSKLAPGNYQLLVFDREGYYQAKKDFIIRKKIPLRLNLGFTDKHYNPLYLGEIFGLVVAVLILCLGLGVLLKLEDKTIGWSFLLMSSTFFLFNGVEFFQIILARLGCEVLAANIFPLKHIGLTWFGFAFLYFWLVFPHVQKFAFTLKALFIIPFLESLVFLSWSFLGSDQAFNSFWHFSYGDYRTLMVIQLIILVCLGFLVLNKVRSTETAADLKDRLKVMEYGLSFFVLLVLGFIFIPAVFWRGETLFPLQYNLIASLSGILLFSIISYAVTQYQIISFPRLVSRSAAYFLLTLFLGFSYALLIVFLDKVFLRANNYLWNAYILMAFIAFAVLIRDRLNQTIERMFFGSIQQKQKELERADRLAALGTIAAGFAHEIKNPLTAINNLIKIFPQNYSDEKFREQFMSIVPRQIERIDQLLKELLNFSRTSTNLKGSVDVGSVLQKALSLLAVSAKKANVKINSEVDPGLKLKGDEKALEQVFINLGLNAIDAMPKGGELLVSLNKRQKKIIIKDTGVGIDPKNLKQIFDPFYTTKPQGTGLGLSISKKILEEHGAQIRVFSQKNKGTTFEILFG